MTVETQTNKNNHCRNKSSQHHYLKNLKKKKKTQVLITLVEVSGNEYLERTKKEGKKGKKRNGETLYHSFYCTIDFENNVILLEILACHINRKKKFLLKPTLEEFLKNCSIVADNAKSFDKIT